MLVAPMARSDTGFKRGGSRGAIPSNGRCHLHLSPTHLDILHRPPSQAPYALPKPSPSAWLFVGVRVSVRVCLCPCPSLALSLSVSRTLSLLSLCRCLRLALPRSLTCQCSPAALPAVPRVRSRIDGVHLPPHVTNRYPTHTRESSEHARACHPVNKLISL